MGGCDTVQSLSSRWVVLFIILCLSCSLEFELIGLFSESSVFQERNVFRCTFYVFLLLTPFKLRNKNKLTSSIKVSHSYVWLLYLMPSLNVIKSHEVHANHCKDNDDTKYDQVWSSWDVSVMLCIQHSVVTSSQSFHTPPVIFASSFMLLSWLRRLCS